MSVTTVTPLTATELDKIPALCGVQDLAAAFGRTETCICVWNKRGKLKRFEVLNPIDKRRWSGVLVRRYLEQSAGEAAEQDSRRFFGSARRRG